MPVHLLLQSTAVRGGHNIGELQPEYKKLIIYEQLDLSIKDNKAE
jgi:hypothetical protein